MRVVDALPAIRSSRFDLPLTYDAGALELAVGDVVRVPLGSREVVAFVVSRRARRRTQAAQPLKPVLERLDVPRAFDETGLHLASIRRRALPLHAGRSARRGRAGRRDSAHARFVRTRCGPPGPAALSLRAAAAGSPDLGRVCRTVSRSSSCCATRRRGGRRIAARCCGHVRALVRGRCAAPRAAARRAAHGRVSRPRASIRATAPYAGRRPRR